MQEQESDSGGDFRQSVNLFWLLVRAHVFCLLPFLRHSFGTNMPGSAGVFALGAIVLGILVTEDVHMLNFLVAWFVALLAQRIHTASLYARGYRWHSHYEGWPWLAKLVARTEAQAKTAEPLLCMGMGGLLMPWSVGVGGFVALGAITLTIYRVGLLAARDREFTSLRDLRIEQQALSEHMRREF